MPIRWFSSVSLSAASPAATPATAHLLGRERVVQVHLWHRLRLSERLEPCDVELGLRERGLALLELRPRAEDLDLLLGPRQLGLRLGELRAGALEGRLVLGPLDLEEDLAFLDVRAFLEPDMLEHALDARAKLHGLDRVGLRHELRRDRDRLLDDLRHDDGRRGRRRGRALLRLGPFAGRHDRKERQEGHHQQKSVGGIRALDAPDPPAVSTGKRSPRATCHRATSWSSGPR